MAAKPKNELPAVLRPRAPDLGGIEVVVQRPEPVSSDEILQRFEALRREVAARTARATGELIEVGDEVIVDIVTYTGDGKTVVAAVQQMELVAGGSSVIPGLGDALPGKKVGERFSEILDSFGGVPADFHVHVTTAKRLALPELDDALYGKLGRGANLSEVLESLANDAQQEQLALLGEEATRRALEAVAERAKLDVPDNLIDLEIGWSWRSGQDPVLAQLGVQMEQREAALRARLNDAQARAEARRRVAVTLTLRAIAEAQGLLVDANAGKPDAEPDSSTLVRDDVLQRVSHLRAVDYVMERVKVRVLPAPGSAT